MVFFKKEYLSDYLIEIEFDENKQNTKCQISGRAIPAILVHLLDNG